MAERRPAHKKGHPDCPHRDWAACDKATAAARPRCTALTEKATECSNFAVDKHDGAGYCGVHYASRVNAELDRKRRSLRKVELDERIERYLSWTKDHPSILDRMPVGWKPQEANPAPVSRRGRVLWSALSGDALRGRG